MDTKYHLLLVKDRFFPEPGLFGVCRTSAFSQLYNVHLTLLLQQLLRSI